MSVKSNKMDIDPENPPMTEAQAPKRLGSPAGRDADHSGANGRSNIPMVYVAGTGHSRADRSGAARLRGGAAARTAAAISLTPAPSSVLVLLIGAVPLVGVLRRRRN